MKFPTTLGACVDAAYKARTERLEYEKNVKVRLDKLKEAEKQIQDHIINTFSKSDIEGARGRLATASVHKSSVAQVEDWDKLFAWIAKTKSFDMLHRRVNDKAYRERLDAKKVVPGVKPFVMVKLSLTKR